MCRRLRQRSPFEDVYKEPSSVVALHEQLRFAAGQRRVGRRLRQTSPFEDVYKEPSSVVALHEQLRFSVG